MSIPPNPVRSEVMILERTRQERLSIADLFDGLTDEQWRTPSLCEGWTVLHVTADIAAGTARRRSSPC